jgi:hypothetical protein
MPLSIRRHAQLLVAIVLVGLLTTCALLSLGVATQSLHLPPVLVDTQVVWIGDHCRTYGNHSGPYMHECPAGYTVDVFVHGAPMRHYVLIHLPSLR